MAAGQTLSAAQYNSDVHKGIALIEEQDLGADALDVTFSNIDQSFAHLWLIANGAIDTGAPTSQDVPIQFNGDTASNYVSFRSGRVGDGTFFEAHNGAASEISTGLWHTTFNANIASIIYGYARVGSNKLVEGSFSVITGTGSNQAILGQVTGVWFSTAAITSLRIFSADGFKAGSVFQLYGLGRA